MKTYDLKTFFDLIKYDWKKDVTELREICRLTKTRVKNPPPDEFLLSGTEQTFLIKAVAEWLTAERFFEIGTGRGTASYAVSLLESIKNITTLDIVPIEQKMNTAIAHRPAVVSNLDILNLIPWDCKTKIDFKLRKDFLPIRTNSLTEENKFDFCFIDGDHTDKRTIVEDFVNCTRVVKQDGVILWDDYGQPQFRVKEVVDRVLESDSSWNALLVEQRGHLFGKTGEKDVGVVVMSKRRLP
jgi:predicted O-methyltransferase YrrM